MGAYELARQRHSTDRIARRAARRLRVLLTATVVLLLGLLATANTATASPVGPSVVDQTISDPFALAGSGILHVGALATGSNNPAGGSLTFTIESCTPLSHPSVTFNASGDVGVNPRVIADVTCTFHATDSLSQQSNTATVHVTVPSPGLPTVSDQSITDPFDRTASVTVHLDALGTGSTNPVGGALLFSVENCTPASHASVSFDSAGNVSVRPNTPIDLTCSFHVVDAAQQTSNTATVHVVVPAPAPPTVTDHMVSQTVGTEMAYADILSSGTTDPAGGGLSFTLDPTACTYNGQADLGFVTYARGDLDVNAVGSDFVGVISCPFTATDINGSTADGTVTINVTGGTPSARVSSDLNPSQSGQLVTFTALITAGCHDCGLIPTGSVTFKDGPTVLGTKTLDGTGHATLSTASLGVGLHHITAVYGGDTFLLGSTSVELVQEALKSDTTTTLTPASTTAALNQPVTFTATVAPVTGPGTPTGTVAFYVDGAGTPAATAALNGTGQASFVWAFGAGTHTVVAVYSGDANFASSLSAPSTVDVRCDSMITGKHGAVTATRGTTCVVNATITGGISVAKGAVLDVQKSTVTGSISANAPAGIRICGSRTRAISVANATGFILIGDPADGCAANTITGTITAANNTSGLVIVGNTISGTVTAHNNSGPGPFPGQSGPVISGNHR